MRYRIVPARDMRAVERSRDDEGNGGHRSALPWRLSG